MHLRNGVVEKRQLRNDAFHGLEALFQFMYSACDCGNMGWHVARRSEEESSNAHPTNHLKW